MKKIALISLALALASCSSKPLEKASLEYKVFPKVANFKYEFNVAIPQVVDARDENFVLNNDEYFEKPVAKALSNILFEEIRSTNSFNTVALLDQSIDFNPSSTQIQEIRRTVGKDAIFLAQINLFNANVRKLSDTDTSNFVNLKVFTNITYKLILADSETVIFLTTKDTSSDKTVPLDENIYKVINELAVNNIKNNIVAAKNDFILTTKGTISGDYNAAGKKQEVKTLKVEKEFNLEEEQRKQAEAEAAKKAEEERLAAEKQAEEAKLAEEQDPVEAKEELAEETAQPTQEQATTEVPAEQTPAEQAATEETVELVESENIEVPAENVTEETAKEISKEVTETAEEVVETVEQKVEEVTKEVTTEVKEAVTETAEKAETVTTDLFEEVR
tara:strand:+ start:193 stop:1362 length:1170 start_codon:yes stop_codon:yes gene_type:complete